MRADEATAWFNEEVVKHDSALKSYLRSRYPSMRDVDDVVQESYVRTWRARLARQVEHSKAFLFSVAKNLALDVLRRNRRSPMVELPDLDPALVLDERPGIVEAAEKQEDLDLLARAISALPSRCRDVMILCRVEGLSQKEVAERLGLSASTVETHVGNGLKRMQAYLEAHRKP